MSLLDDQKAIQELDASDMGAAIASLPQQCQEAWGAAQNVALPPECAMAENAVLVGMGGSSIGNALLTSLIERRCSIPLVVLRDYRLPGFVNEQTIVIASSYSGETEETLAAVREARERHAALIALSSGGKLAALADDWNIPFYRIPFKGQPRAALGHSLIPLLVIAQRLGWIPSQEKEVPEAIAVVKDWGAELAPQVPTANNSAKQLATRLHGQVPVIYGAEHLSQVARRWNGQFNENAKTFATFSVLPELNHNIVEGYRHPEGLLKQLRVLILCSERYHARNALRCKITGEVLQNNGIAWEEAQGRGTSRLAEALSLIHFGDWVSYYLALLNGEDPTKIANIGHVKQRLAESPS